MLNLAVWIFTTLFTAVIAGFGFRLGWRLVDNIIGIFEGK